MTIYKHRLMGALISFALGFGVVLTATAVILVPVQHVVVGLVVVILLLCIFLFWSLTVEVTEDELVVSFGPGVIRKRFRIEDIHDAQIVRNPWYYGWGVRLTPHGWLFNVSGFDAVELERTGNRKLRIGTDDPEQLLTAIQRASQIASSP